MTERRKYRYFLLDVCRRTLVLKKSKIKHWKMHINGGNGFNKIFFILRYFLLQQYTITHPYVGITFKTFKKFPYLALTKNVILCYTW